MALSELSPAQYPSVLPLFAPLDFNLVIRSVAAGITPGWVYVDDPNAPHFALLWDRQDGIAIAGSASPQTQRDLLLLLRERIVPDARLRGVPEMALLYTAEWRDVLPELLREYDPQPALRYSYRLPEETLRGAPLPRAAATPGYQIKGSAILRIDDALLASHLINLDDMRGWIDSFWRSPQEFLHTGFGYCVIRADAICAWCLTVFAAADQRELGLKTVAQYRGQGLATQLTLACIEHALAHGINLHWHCWADNQPSAAVARKAGFQLEREYSVYRLNLVQPA